MAMQRPPPNSQQNRSVSPVRWTTTSPLRPRFSIDTRWTNWSDASRISRSVAGGWKLNRVLMLRHMCDSAGVCDVRRSSSRGRRRGWAAHRSWRDFGCRPRRAGPECSVDRPLTPRLPSPADAAPCKRRRKVGHSMWLGAGQTAACRRPSRIALNLRIVWSNSAAFAESSRRSMRGWPSGANILAISSREKPAERPSAISARRCSTAGAKTRRRPCRPTGAIRPFSS